MGLLSFDYLNPNMKENSCCVSAVPFLIMGTASLNESYSACATFNSVSGNTLALQCLGCDGFVEPEVCASECHARRNCQFYQYEPLVEYFLTYSTEEHYQCAFRCDAQGLTRRICACGQCSLFDKRRKLRVHRVRRGIHAASSVGKDRRAEIMAHLRAPPATRTAL